MCSFLPVYGGATFRLVFFKFMDKGLHTQQGGVVVNLPQVIPTTIYRPRLCVSVVPAEDLQQRSHVAEDGHFYILLPSIYSVRLLHHFRFFLRF